MKANYPSHRNRSLQSEIHDLHRRVLMRRAELQERSSSLVRTFKAKLTSPGSLLASAGFGFILGEITDRRTFKVHRKPQAGDVSRTETRTFRPYRFVLLASAAMNSWPVKALSSILQGTPGPRRDTGPPERPL